ncbi:transposase, IS4 family domain protein, partial [Piscirickettsia salmonis LF-89 = ATCC VR-1361]
MNKELLDIYSDYLISQNHYATATGLSDLLEGSISHDKVTRFLNKNHFESKELWSYVKKHVRQYEEEVGG